MYTVSLPVRHGRERDRETVGGREKSEKEKERDKERERGEERREESTKRAHTES